MSTSDATLDPAVRPPRQERSRRTLERLEKAALELVARDGPEAVTIAAVVARAGSSVGSFYARFQGKDELFLHLAEGLRRQALERWRALDVNGSPDPIRATVAFLLDDELHGGAQRRALAAQGEPGADGGEFNRVVAVDLHRALAARPEPTPDPGAVALAIRIVRAALAAVLSVGTHPPADAGPAADPSALRPLLEEVVRGLVRSGGSGADAPPPTQTEEATPESASDIGADASLLLDPAPLEDESPPADPFDVWG